MLFCLEELGFVGFVCFSLIVTGSNVVIFDSRVCGLAFAEALIWPRLGRLIAALVAAGLGVGLSKLPGAMMMPSLIRGVSCAFSGGLGFEAIELALE